MRGGGGEGGRNKEIPGAQIVSNNDRECPQHSSRGTQTDYTDGWMAGEDWHYTVNTSSPTL
jgi:hypothetical protein